MMWPVLAVLCPCLKSTCSMPIENEACAKVIYQDILEKEKWHYTQATSVAYTPLIMYNIYPHSTLT